jgi:hypothetical protein
MSPETMIAAADECLYRSKRAGRNRATSCELAAAGIEHAALPEAEYAISQNI